MQWYWLIVYAAITIPFAPFVRDPRRFFRGGLNDDSKGIGSLLLLAASASISWVFAKSIYNASTLGAQYGIVGGIAYAGWYTSFPNVAVVIYLLRTRRGVRSLPLAINERYGSLATLSFGLAVLFRLFQEVWSNALVVGGFYGPAHSREWWLGAVLSTAIPVVYAFTGGMRASIMTDSTQIVITIGFLIVVMIVIGIHTPVDLATFNPAGTCALAGAAASSAASYSGCAAAGGAEVASHVVQDASRALFSFTNATCSYPTIPTQQMWSLEGGVDLLIVGVLQGCGGYPFFDPVLTDRAFLAEPRTMLWAFMLGGVVAGAFIILFGLLGVFGAGQAIMQPSSVPASLFTGMLDGMPSSVSRFFGVGLFSVTNLIFIFESLSTLDSTFTSAAKLFGPEFTGLLEDGMPKPPQRATITHLAWGRLVIVVLAAVGLLPLLMDVKALDATTVSGLVVMGLAPPIVLLLFTSGYRPLTFHLPFWWGVGMGAVYQLASAPCCKATIEMAGFAIGNGKNNKLLGFNVIGVVVAWILALVTLLENPLGSLLTQGPTEGNSFWRAGFRQRTQAGDPTPTSVRRVEEFPEENGKAVPYGSKAVLQVEPATQV
ncbi:hypothetical protein WJX81_005358 [Elliptochloris bilobata]|uniref:Uncharacterized protein n=1 Tax=Elliptochloris bilobata TaxID=381761 RepID=A0AAW1RD45_9CHLO